jgi:hypothetical protein
MDYHLLITHRRLDLTRSTVDLAPVLETLGEWVEMEPSVYVLWTSTPRWEVYKQIRCAVGEEDGLTGVTIPSSAFGRDGLPPLATKEEDQAQGVA